MNCKIMGLVGIASLCGLMAFGNQSMLYDQDGKTYDIGNAKFTSFGNALCAYDVRISHWFYTNATYGTAVILYNGTYGSLTVLAVGPAYAGTYPPIWTFEATWTGGDGPFSAEYCDGSRASNNSSQLSWTSFYPALSETRGLLYGSVVTDKELTFMPMEWPDIGKVMNATSGTYIFHGYISGDISLRFWVYSDMRLDYFPQPTGYPASAYVMSVDLFNGGCLLGTTFGIFYAFRLVPEKYRVCFMVLPSSTLPLSCSIACNSYQLLSENWVRAITPNQFCDMGITLSR